MARTTHIQQLVIKPWGHELIIENSKEDNLCLKILNINQREMFSWQFHKNKTEVFYVTKGNATLLYGRVPDITYAEVIYLKVGDSFKIYPYQWHQIRNNTDSELEIMECSTFHEDSDTYRDAAAWKDVGDSRKKD